MRSPSVCDCRKGESRGQTCCEQSTRSPGAWFVLIWKGKAQERSQAKCTSGFISSRGQEEDLSRGTGEDQSMVAHVGEKSIFCGSVSS